MESGVAREVLAIHDEGEKFEEPAFIYKIIKQGDKFEFDSNATVELSQGLILVQGRRDELEPLRRPIVTAIRSASRSSWATRHTSNREGRIYLSLSCGSSIKNENHQKEKERKRSNTRRGVVKGKQKGYLFKEPHKKETLQSSKSRSTQTKRIASCPAKMTICLTPKNQSRKHTQPEKQLWCWKIASLVSEHRGHVKAEKLEIRVDLEKLKVIQELSDIGEN